MKTPGPLFGLCDWLPVSHTSLDKESFCQLTATNSSKPHSTKHTLGYSHEKVKASAKHWYGFPWRCYYFVRFCLWKGCIYSRMWLLIPGFPILFIKDVPNSTCEESWARANKGWGVSIYMRGWQWGFLVEEISELGFEGWMELPKGKRFPGSGDSRCKGANV